MTFFVMHILGRDGMPRRVADYPAGRRLEGLNQVASIGYVVLVASFVPFVINVVQSLRSPATVGADPWEANSLEWATTSPPPVHNFTWLPPIRSERPVFDLRWSRHPDVASAGTAEAMAARRRAAEVGAGVAAGARRAVRREAGDDPVDRRTAVLRRDRRIYKAVGGDPAGVTLLLLASALGGLIAGWTWDWRRRHPRPPARGPRRR